MSYADTIRKWFDFREYSHSLFIPDGSVGRPGDEEYSFISIIEQGERLVLKLTSNPNIDTALIILTFYGLETVEMTEEKDVYDLVLTSFKFLEYEGWGGYYAGHKPDNLFVLRDERKDIGSNYIYANCMKYFFTGAVKLKSPKTLKERGLK